MQVKLGDLANGTEFEHLGKKWRKGYTYCNNAVKCDPYLGGRFQDKLADFISLDTVVVVK